MIKASFLIPAKSGMFIDVQEIIDKSVLYQNAENPLEYILYLEANPKEESIILHIESDNIDRWDYQRLDKEIRKLIIDKFNERMWLKIEHHECIYFDLLRDYFVDNFTSSNPFPDNEDTCYGC